MMQKLLLSSLCLWVWLSLSEAVAQTSRKYSNEFLAIGVGARGLGMANTQAAISNDVTAAYWNPAGLMHIDEPYEFSFMHASYFAGIANYNYAGFTAAIDDKSRMAVSLIRLGIDDIPDTRFLFDESGNLDYSRVGSFAEASYAFLFSYARGVDVNIKEKRDEEGNIVREAQKLPIQLGANFKVINRTAGIFASAWGFGLDIGAQTQWKDWYFGITGRDISGTFNAWSFNTEAVADVFDRTGNAIPVNGVEVTVPRLIVGVAKAYRIGEKKDFGILPTVGFEATFDGKRNTVIKSDFASINPSAGVEADYKNMIFVRSGLGNFQQIKDFDNTYYTTFQPNFGVGFRYRHFTIDYALTNAFEQADVPYSNVFSIKVRFANKDLQFLKNDTSQDK
ncbi:MAG: hypothetical protein JJT94_05200 [Bernardetiaceae bacterium]|nr:hypothetical protein [Bernardetiaceae bacterium]